ncbi:MULTISPECIES: type IV toxin-antitoxin system AbiEi family antitoxin domain-containing protein [Lacticaseibacillus]|mgnify:CR=1 FL=1|jgi:predicted transcriptional regulator of viral defense system|uniref:Transcriptional regulator n=2 Tax=Lacticaseibacillus TaxID=2759736 RepID=A0AAD1ETX6_LACCA|nr:MULTISPECIES: type IV toxin-antitoxin system AbiEi family antitoxin domain-containing protein [Lacticaseibacillus]HAJ53948.1 transcriptional regulator [Lactobacillus sp.]MBI6598596.1 transcriptional regulator [Lacticaseibacillus casei]MBO1482256.1 transcriptional regulator [Lacticaseibacillus casei]MBO2417534.1 transcriptional regulator [Lacticaseibacillus casei]MCK2081921.1 transcriptional regulator [Lacticaseibacillus casei]
MGKNKGLDSLLADYHTFVSGTAAQYGVSSSMLTNAIREGRISREARGVYVENGYTWDDFAILSQRYSRGVFALDTALFLYGLTDQIPDRFIMAFPRGYRNPRLSEHWIVPIYYVPNRYFPGITTVETPNMNFVRTYSVERTLLDVWERPDVAPYTRNEAFKNYFDEYGQNNASFERLLKLKKQLYPHSDLTKLLEVLV